MCIAHHQMTLVFPSMTDFEKVLLDRILLLACRLGAQFWGRITRLWLLDFNLQQSERMSNPAKADPRIVLLGNSMYRSCSSSWSPRWDRDPKPRVGDDLSGESGKTNILNQDIS